MHSINPTPAALEAFQSFSPAEQVSNYSAENDACEDLTEEDLRCLQGEMPLTTKSRKKWKH